MACDNGNNYDTPVLPEELLIEIFLRSSVESLLRVKCVCNHWYGLIKDRSLEYKHLEYQKNKKIHRLLLETDDYNNNTHVYSYAVLDDKTQSSTSLQNLSTFDPLTVEGPVNGLYCLYNCHDRVVLWNPALKAFKLLPIPPPPSLPHCTSASGHVGFGIDPLTDNYKVVLIRYFYDSRNHMVLDPVVTLYSLIRNAWKPFDLGDFHLHHHPTRNLSSSFLNGTCHWWCRWGGFVLAFDLRNESFRVIPGPNFSRLDYPCHFINIGVYEEQLAVWRSDNKSVDLSVMLEEGIWIEKVSIRSFPDLVWPCGFLNNKGPLLVLDGCNRHRCDPNARQMVSYDINTREMRNIGPGGIDRSSRAWVYFESLVSLDGGTNCDVEMVSNFLDGRPMW